MRCCRPCRILPLPSPAPTFTLVLYGDVPLTRAATLQRLIDAAGRDKLALLTAHLDNPQGYGRIVRVEGKVTRIVEEKDADDAERAIREINTGILVAPTAALARWLPDAGQPQRAGRVLPDRHRRHGGRRRHAGGDRASGCRLGNRGREQQAAAGRSWSACTSATSPKP
jgi:hypothetical protein